MSLIEHSTPGQYGEALVKTPPETNTKKTLITHDSNSFWWGIHDTATAHSELQFKFMVYVVRIQNWFRHPQRISSWQGSRIMEFKICQN